jgi:hypothetical protein
MELNSAGYAVEVMDIQWLVVYLYFMLILLECKLVMERTLSCYYRLEGILNGYAAIIYVVLSI